MHGITLQCKAHSLSSPIAMLYWAVFTKQHSCLASIALRASLLVSMMHVEGFTSASCSCWSWILEKPLAFSVDLERL